MDRSKAYAKRLSKIEKDLRRDNNMERAIERVAWVSNIPIWWLEQFAPNWAQQAELHEMSKPDRQIQQEIRESSPRDGPCGSPRSFRISLPRSTISED